MYSFLMIGQSNMAGRGHIDDVPPVVDSRIYMLRNGRWVGMFVPVNPDRKTAGVCLAESFAECFVQTYNTDVGLIPCADGGTRLDQWMPGELLYENALNQARLAMRTSELAGVLWHQGESDIGGERYLAYEEKCTHIFTSLRRDLELSEEIPFLVGGLGDFLKDHVGKTDFGNYFKINEALQCMTEKHSYISFVPAHGLTCYPWPDDMHFDAVSLREFGRRYFEAFHQRIPQLKASVTSEEGMILTELEKR